jgi:ligand-binding SRPBCC domain-containing protein
MIKIPDASRIVSLISEINHIYPDTIQIYRIKSQQYCPRNHYDPIRKVATDVNCPICKGKGIIYVYESITLPANIDYVDEIQAQFIEAGTVFIDKLYITIDKNEITTYNIEPDQIQFIMYDNVKYKVKQFRKEYLNGIYYELVLEVERID